MIRTTLLMLVFTAIMAAVFIGGAWWGFSRSTTCACVCVHEIT
jgi:preprotein translocase subunit SecE